MKLEDAFKLRADGPGGEMESTAKTLYNDALRVMESLGEMGYLFEEAIGYMESSGDDVAVRELRANQRTFEDTIRDVKNSINTCISASNNCIETLGGRGSNFVR